jgi:hypothetical protein
MFITLGLILSGLVIGALNYDKCKCYIKEATVTFIMRTRSRTLN